jgi:hypothetical protein
MAEVVVKNSSAKRYNKKVIPKEFNQGDLILRRGDIWQRNVKDGKLAKNWEGSYRIAAALKINIVIITCMKLNLMMYKLQYKSTIKRRNKLPVLGDKVIMKLLLGYFYPT